MTKQQVEQRVVEIICKQLACEPAQVTPTATLDTLNADSLDKVDVVMQIEEEYKIVLPDEDIDRMKNIGDLMEATCAYIEGEEAVEKFRASHPVPSKEIPLKPEAA